MRTVLFGLLSCLFAVACVDSEPPQLPVFPGAQSGDEDASTEEEEEEEEEVGEDGASEDTDAGSSPSDEDVPEKPSEPEDTSTGGSGDSQEEADGMECQSCEEYGDPGPCNTYDCDCSVVPANEGEGCEGSDPCFEAGTCQAGECVAGNPVVCEDGIECTADSCDPETGCVHEPNDGVCEDGNPCTATSCSAEQGCISESVNGPCDDGDPCSTGDQCADGVCAGEDVANCGCVEDSDCAEFDDDNLCNGQVLCAGGCQLDLFTVVNCPESGNPCAISVCEPATGTCTTAPVDAGAPCDDGDPCTSGDSCNNGTCSGDAGAPAGVPAMQIVRSWRMEMRATGPWRVLGDSVV